MKFEETTLISNYLYELKGEGQFIPDAKLVIDTAKSFIIGITDYLSEVKTKDKMNSVVVSDLKGNFIIAAAVSYTEGEDEKSPGNWNYFWTFDEKDIEDSVKHSLSTDRLRIVINTRAFQEFRVRFTTFDYITDLGIRLFRMISDFLDQNAKDGETLNVECEGYFVASVDVINGENVKAFIPDGAMKRLIKDDAEASESVE